MAVAQQVTISRDSTVYAEPNASAAAVTQLKPGATAQVVGRQGAWVNIQTPSGAGWVYSFNVQYPAAAGGGVPAASSARRPSTIPTAGIRGLDKEDLKNATFDGKQLDALDSFAGEKDPQKK